MSDGITESRRGTYFLDRSQPPPSEKEWIQKRIFRLESEISDANFELADLRERLKKIESKDSDKIT